MTTQQGVQKTTKELVCSADKKIYYLGYKYDVTGAGIKLELYSKT